MLSRRSPAWPLPELSFLESLVGAPLARGCCRLPSGPSSRCGSPHFRGASASLVIQSLRFFSRAPPFPQATSSRVTLGRGPLPLEWWKGMRLLHFPGLELVLLLFKIDISPSSSLVRLDRLSPWGSLFFPLPRVRLHGHGPPFGFFSRPGSLFSGFGNLRLRAGTVVVFF